MAVSAILRVTEVTVAPGGAGRCHVLVRNNSVVVDQFAFTVRGDVSDWTQVKPSRVNLMPNQEVSVELTFAPPRSHEVAAGRHPFALQASSREDPGGSVVQEGVVIVEKFTEVVAQIVPVTSTGRMRGSHTLAVDNLGNHEHGIEVVVNDPDLRLVFRTRPRAPRLTPGSATFVRVRAKPRQTFWKGQDRRLPFAVQVLPPGAEPIVVEANMIQRPLVPRRAFWLLTSLLMLVVVLAILVTALLRQRPVSIAGPAPLTMPLSTPATTTTGVSSAPSSVSSAAPTTTTTRRSGGSGGSTGGSGGSTRDDSPGGGTGGTVGSSFVVRSMAAPGMAGRAQLFSYVVPEGRRLRVLSARLGAPAGDTGRVEVRHGDTVLATFDLAALARGGVSHTFADPPLAQGGEKITLAVFCGNADRACTPSGEFAAALVR
jgi:hypothetical protein